VRAARLAGILAFCVSLPALAVPFLSDDWVNLAAASEGSLLRTPFDYFRPLYLASFRAELAVWGMNSVPFHLANALLIAACAVLVAVTIERMSGEAGWAAAAGALFAIHPYHVENAGWIAARADVAATLLVLIAWLAYARWARTMRGIPVGALIAFEAALLFKESVVCFPVLVLLLRVWKGDGRSRGEALRGIAPLGLVAVVHFLVLRRAFLGDSGLRPAQSLGIAWAKRGVDFFSATLIPIHAERVESHPALVALLAIAVLLVLCALARPALRAGGVLATALLFLASLAPSLLSFQERYLFLPSVISCAALAYLLRNIRPRLRVVASVVVATIWLGSLATHWSAWLEAGRASRTLVAGLTEASRREGVGEIVVANQPYRVAGVAVAGDLRAAVRLSGGGRARIVAATSLNLPAASASGIEGAPATANDRAVLRVGLPRGVYSGLFLPLDRPAGTVRVEDYGTLTFQEGDRVTVEILRSDTRGAYVWQGGRLETLF